MQKVMKNLFKLKNDIISLTKSDSKHNFYNYNYVIAVNNIIELLYGDEKVIKGSFEEFLRDDDIEYIREIFSSECLTFKKQKEYILNHDMNNFNDRHILINGCLWMSAILSLNYINNGVEYIDLLQQSYFGIESAINKYGKSAKSFSTLVKEEVIYVLRKYVMEYGKFGHISNKNFDLINSLEQCRDLFLNNNGYDGNVYDIADYLNYPVDSLEELILISSDSVDIDEIDGELSGERIESRVVDVEEEAIKNYDYTDIVEACNLALNDREKYVIYHYYGLNNCSCMNYNELSACLDCSCELIRQIVYRALYKIRMKHKAILDKRRGLLTINDVKQLRKNKITF